jgi:LPS O-antigen subunit length determinant protein (WzzB/FepE family)
MVRNRILELKDVVRTYTQQWQSKYAIIGLGAIGIILATMRTKYTKLNVQTGLNPENIGG